MKGKKQLYCCSSYYQLLISLMKALTEGITIDLVLEEHGLETAGKLSEQLAEKAWACVDQVYVCPTSEKVDPYLKRNASFWPWQRREIVRHMRQVFGIKDRDLPAQYDKIHVFWDLGYAGTYLNILGIHYILHEDSLNSYQHIRENRPHYAYIFRQDGLEFYLKKKLHIVIPFGYSACADIVELNDKEGIDIPPDKVREAKRDDLENQMTPEQKKKIFDLFTLGKKPEISVGDQSVLILTEPFAYTGRLPDETAQKKLYHDLIDSMGPDCSIVIKPHPRDTLDYAQEFPKAEVMEKTIPMEVLNYDADFHVSRAVTITSAAIGSIRCAGESVSLGPEYLKQFKENNKMD